MKMIKSTLKLILILYICVALSGIYALSASARITPHEGDEDTRLITIVKGDTLWDLCQEHLKDPLKWRELSKYNDFTNPDLIYPGEKLRIPLAMAKEMEEDVDDDIREGQREIDDLTLELKLLQEKLEKAKEETDALKKDLEKAVKNAEALEKQLKSQDKAIEAVQKSADSVTSAIKKELAATQAAIEKKITQTNRRINALEKSITEQNSVIEAIQKQLTTINQNIETALKRIEMNQQALKEIRKAIEDAKGVHEEISSSKRALVLITTVAAGVGWFVINAIGGRSGD